MSLYALQRNPKDQTEVNTSSRRVARQVLIYLESADKNAKPRYTFGNGAIPTGNSRPSNYFKNKPTSKDILIQIFHTKKESADKNAKPRYTFGNGAIPTGNSRPSNYFKNKPTSKDILIQIFHTKKGKVVAINFGKNGYMVTMIMPAYF